MNGDELAAVKGTPGEREIKEDLHKRIIIGVKPKG